MELFVDDARRAKIVDDIKLPANAAEALAHAQRFESAPIRKIGVPPKPLDERCVFCAEGG